MKPAKNTLTFTKMLPRNSLVRSCARFVRGRALWIPPTSPPARAFPTGASFVSTKNPGRLFPGVGRRGGGASLSQLAKAGVRNRATCSASSNGAGDAADEGGYRTPPPEILDIISAPPEPSISLSPCRTKMLLLHRPPPLPPVAELARPELKLAGLRLDPSQHSRSRMGGFLGLGMADVPTSSNADTNHRDFEGLPEGSVLNFVSWSPSGMHVAFTVRSDGEAASPPRAPLTLWVADVSTMQCRPLLPGQPLNCVFEEYTWVDDATIVATVIPPSLPDPPSRPPTPSGPRIQSNLGGGSAQTRTYQDLLKDKHDEALFDYYGEARVVLVNLDGDVTPLGDETPRIYTRVSPSPDGQFFIVEYLQRPYSYLVPCGRFPKTVEVWSRAGETMRTVASLPLAENIPIVHNATRQGPRAVNWRSDKLSELYWCEAQDEGDPRKEAAPRDIVYCLSLGPPEPAGNANGKAAKPTVLITTDLRFGGVQWGDDRLALVYESWYKTRRSVIRRFAPGDATSAPQILFDRYYEDAYNDPGSPLTRRAANGEYVLATLDGGSKLVLMGSGHRPEGKQPFVDVLDICSGATQRIWESQPPYLEHPIALMETPHDGEMTLDNLSLLISRETPLDPPQYFVRTWPAPFDADVATDVHITDFPHPYPALRHLQKEILRYERGDGTPLTATLYTPPGYSAQESGPLPTLVWAYPREFKTKEAAGQLRDSPYRFTGIGASSPLLHLARGYAVLDGPTMPIIGEGEDEPNDTYVEQLTASARAAVDEVVRRGVAHPDKIAVGGHSYGAFMTANLLAHAGELFCCGIARSGAYNRTLTPFGFQAEERTIWQTPETYMKMSPFLMADRISKPLLLVHGEDDNNSGTFPMQSERFYSALKGHGAVCRLVLLPHESHGYRGRESIHHSLWETCNWLDAYCKAAEAPTTSDATNGAGHVDAVGAASAAEKDEGM